MPDIRRIRTTFADVPREVLFGFDPGEIAARRASAATGAHICDDRCDHHGHRHRGDGHHDHAHEDGHHSSHTDEFEAWSWSRAGHVDETAFRRAVRTLPADLLRAKGIVGAGDGSGRRLVFQLVGRRSSILAEVHAAPALSQVVAIARRGALDRARLDALFDACLI